MKLLSLSRIALFCFMISTNGVGQEVWRGIPITPRGPQDPKLRGAVVDAKLTINNKTIDARMVISGAHQSESYSIGFLVKDLFNVIPERVFWPYMAPDLGKEALNPNMVVISLYEKNIKKNVFNFRLTIGSGGHYPKEIFQMEDYLFDASAPKGEMNSFIANLSSGFDYGIAIIGHGVFKHPIEIKFNGKGIEQPLAEVMDFVGKPKIKSCSPPKPSQGK